VRVPARALGRQALHAGLLAFRHPGSGQIMRFEAAPPPDFGELLAALRRWRE
jgi:23S rRNA pseudouridine1911/1915/1917 synthase